MDVPAMMAGLTPSSSKASSISTWASPRAEPPPSARPMRGPDALMLLPARVSRFRPGRRRLRGGECGGGSAGDDGRQRLRSLAGEHAGELAPQLLLGRRRRGQHLLEAVEVEHVELVDLDIDVDVGLPGLELLAHDRALQDLRGRHQRGEGRRLRMLAGPDGGAADVDGHRDVGLAAEDVEGQRIDEPAVHQQATAEGDRREQRRQRDAGGNRGAQRPLADDHLLLRVEVRRHDLERNLQVGEVARDLGGQQILEQRLGLEQG